MQATEPPLDPASGDLAEVPGLRREPPYAIGASVIGPGHTRMGLVCQDACASEVLPSGCVLIAVADGLGSASKSDLGAKTAVAAAIQKGKQLMAEAQPQILLSAVVKEVFAFARQSLSDKGREEGCKLRDLACTLIVVLGDSRNVAVGQVGDGAVVAQVGTAFSVVSGPGDSEYANEVTPLTDEKWTDSLRIATCDQGAECWAVFTDGCQRAAFVKTSTGVEPYAGFFGPIFSYARGLTSLREGEEDIKRLLASKKICDNSEDDKTLVIAVLKDAEVARL